MRRYICKMPFKKQVFTRNCKAEQYEQTFYLEGLETHPKLRELLLNKKSKVVNEACRNPVKVVSIERKTSTNKKLQGLLIQIDDTVYLYDS